MPSDDEIQNQQELLAVYREKMAYYRFQNAFKSEDGISFSLEYHLRKTSSEILRIKGVLRDWGVSVDDHPDDIWIITSRLDISQESGIRFSPQTEIFTTGQKLSGYLLADSISNVISIGLDLLFLKNPQRTSLGVLLGFLLQTLTHIFDPYIKQIEWINFSNIQWYQYCILGIAILYLPILIKDLFTSINLGEDVEVALKVIREAKKDGLSKSEVSQLYMLLNQIVLEKIVLNEDSEKEIAVIEEEKKSKIA